jgi:hypothetical protein
VRMISALCVNFVFLNSGICKHNNDMSLLIRHRNSCCFVHNVCRVFMTGQCTFDKCFTL